jgi:hypothetical protein
MNVFKKTRALFGKKSSKYDLRFHGKLKGKVVNLPILVPLTFRVFLH